MNTEYLLSFASYLESKRKASAFVLAALLFLIASITGISEIVKTAFATFELSPYVIAAGMFVFCYSVTLLVLSACSWALSLSTRAFKILSAFLVKKVRALQSSFATRRLTKRRITSTVMTLTPHERAFLELFRTSNSVDLHSTTCKLLPNSTYNAHWGLITKGLVVKSSRTRESCVEHFVLSSEVIPTLQKLIYAGKKPVFEIDLRLDCVEGSKASGGAGSRA